MNRWTNDPHQTVPDGLAAELRKLRNQRGGPFGAALLACRESDWGVPALAAAVGMKPDAVSQQINRARRAGKTTNPGLDIPRPPVPANEHPARGAGLRPNPPLPQRVIDHLRVLHYDARRVRAHMPHDHPYRVASRHLAEDIDQLLKRYRKARIVDALGVKSYRAVDYLLERHGLKPRAPSATRTPRGDYVRGNARREPLTERTDFRAS